MTLMAPDAPPQDYLLEFFLSLDTPEGIRAELIEGEIVLSPAPDGDHEDAIAVITKQVYSSSKTSMDASANKGLELPRDAQPTNHVIPDITLAPSDLRPFRGKPSWMEPDGVAMVVEVTSTKPEADRITKRRSYARAGIPLYLLVDRDRETVTLFSDPRLQDYTATHTAPFGEPLHLPAPFGFDLETADFL
ncbi:Uma2 family endonuclease [Streptomyces boninensis]|uniref:Uma2 family endonuclease n=1 Tax=Streptomyces boninensis TaxID=2039455 RepID=UPI003B21A2FB